MKRVVIHIGGLYATAQPDVIETVLGSCVSACLFDPIHRIGGMNHIFLAESCQGDPFLARYGVHAMELLIARIVRLGGESKHLSAKVFGAASVLRMNEDRFNVPRKNEKFVREFLRDRAIPLVAERLGGEHPLKIRMFADTGRVLVKPLAISRLNRLLKRETRAGLALSERWRWFDGAQEVLTKTEPIA